MGSNKGAHSNVCPYGYVKKFDTSPFLLLFFSRGSRYVDFDFLFESSFFFFQNPPARHSTLPHGELERQTNSLSRSSFFKTHQPTTQTFLKGNLRIFLLNYSSLWETFVFFSPHWRVLPRLKDLFLYFFIFLLVISYICWICIGYKTSIWSCI